MTALPDTSSMYTALVKRDASFDGVFFAAIRTTGIFCRPGCGARKPRPENVEYFPSASDALHAGYRPCMRCRPMEPAAITRTPGWVHELIKYVDNNPDRRIRSQDLRDRGVDPARAARFFKSHYGMTFQAYCRARRLGPALGRLRRGTPIARAASDAGFASESGFRKAFETLFGAPPTPRDIPSPDRDGASDVLKARWLETPLGPMLAVASGRAVCLLEYVDRRALAAQIDALRRRLKRPVTPGDSPALQRLERELKEYFAGTRTSFTLELEAPGTPFQERVWAALRKVPHGQTRSYLQIARAIGQPTATRAVAKANGDNRLAILIPCHRIIGADGSLTGYGGKIWRKQALLELEGALPGAPCTAPLFPAATG